MKRTVPAVVVALLALLTLGGPAAAASAPTTVPTSSQLPETLRVGTEGVYTPFSYHDASGELTGFDVEFMDAVAARLGVRVEYVETPWDSMFAALQAKRFDVVANQVTYNDERNALYDLSKPYIETTGVLVVREDETQVKGLADLRGKRSAQNRTSNWAEVAKEAGATVVGVEDMSLAITNLEQGRVDALVNDKLAIANYLATNPGAKVKVVAETDDVSRPVLAARKGSGYLPQLNRATTS